MLIYFSCWQTCISFVKRKIAKVNNCYDIIGKVFKGYVIAQFMVLKTNTSVVLCTLYYALNADMLVH